MDEILKAFLIECHENLDFLDQELVALENETNEQISRDILASIFRKIHTIKGSCGWLGLPKLESVAHVGENLLTLLRDKTLTLTQEHTNALLKMLDTIREILSRLEGTESEGDGDYTGIISTLTILQRQPKSPDATETSTIPQEKAETTLQESKTEQPKLIKKIKVASKKTGETASVSETVETETTKKVRKKSSEQKTEKEISKITSVVEQSVRVDVNLLVNIMDLVGELVLTRNQLVQLTSNHKESIYTSITQHLNKITTDLQEKVMKTRMQPVGNVWNKLPRMVRDLSNACKKKVLLEMDGEETELDKSLLEAITDPITHQVRNAIDHGIELPEERLAAGKPVEGTVKLKAYHEGGQVHIEISDDGAGINLIKVKDKALSIGLITPGQANAMTDQELTSLIFQPGFSTAENVTNMSGRGVGMDVVKSYIEKIGGNIDIESRFGLGTKLKIKIPLTLAIIPALIISCGDTRYAISQSSLVELLVLKGQDAINSVEIMHSTPVYRLRGRLLPLVYLNRQFRIETRKPSHQEEESLSIVVLSANGKQFGLVVDRIIDSQEIVVKPISKLLKNVAVYSGTTIMGDGKVALILDVLGLAQTSNVISDINLVDEKTLDLEDTTVDDKQQLLLFLGPDNSRMASPLSTVSRLEKFENSKVEDSGSLSVIQYGDQLLPLIYISKFLTERRQHRRNDLDEYIEQDDQYIHVIVHQKNNKTLGLVVDRILDIIEDTIEIKLPPSRKGVIGSIILQQQVTELLDLDAIIHMAHPTFFKQRVIVESTPQEIGA